ncbi:Lipase class 3 [Penicillium atrosanguineum]|uniref:Lipase class 3 n=1 Tax=Penicillium atrosanguineum TaxID=1132637 RepID=UPI00239D8776|nr:Lipase class 3 [Penicillium atrosanguineum]KAJ5303812.1 Lipase class 3 [Penicillium atrosanguineum]
MWSGNDFAPGIMNWLRRSSQPRDSPARGRALAYLVLAAVFCILSYQLVLNHESISRWAEEQGFVVIDNVVTDGDPDPEPSEPSTYAPEKELVLAAMSSSDMTWAEDLSWPVNIYRADVQPGKADLTVPVNKGNEAMVYLTYLIDRYDSLPDVTVFLHGARYQWHNDNPLYDSVVSIQNLNLDFVREAGYVNLRCSWMIGCPAELEPARYLRERPDDPNHPTATEFPDQFKILFPDMPVPELVGGGCCSQFALSREQVLQRPKSDYERFRRWLMDTKLDSGTSGRVLEYSWHMIFGKPPQHCPDPREMYCKIYGLCNMTEFELQNQWIWRGLVLPDGWPETRG